MTSDTPSRGEFFGLGSEQAAESWPLVLPFIERALRYGNGGWTAGDVLQALVRQEMQLWVYQEGARLMGVVVTRIAVYPSRKIAVILLTAGDDLKRWFGHLATIEAWALHEGCAAMQLFGRRGWERLLRDWRRQVMLFKELGDVE